MDNLTMQAGIRWKKIPFLLCLIFAGYFAGAQVTISGKVTDAKKEAVPGISIQVKNTSYGTSSDATGAYTMQANLKPGSYTVEFSGIGFKAVTKTLQVGSESKYTLDAELTPDAIGMDEVIVTGTSAGTTRKQLGNYVSTVKAEDLNKGATGNVLAALQGKTAGAQISQNSGDPAGGISVRLRGISSINSSSEPLYIVDGVIINNATNRVTNTSSGYDGANTVGTIGQNRMVDINPADIERVEVLNGAAAAAIYGSRANAGVVQIFTKRGKAGAPQVSFSSSFLMNQLRKKLDMNQSPVKFGGSVDDFTHDVIARVNGDLVTTTSPVNRYDYQDYVFRTGTGTDNNVSVSGGNDKTKYFVSGSYFFNQGIVKNTDFQRYSFRANVDQTFNKWLSVNMGLNYVNSKANEKPDGNSFFSPVGSINIIGNYHDIWKRDASGNLLKVGNFSRVNPVSVIEDMKQQQTTSRVLASLGVKLKPVKNLTIDYTMGIDNYAQNGTTFIPPYAYTVNPGYFGGSDDLNGYASAATNTFFQINHELNATYTANISDDLGSTTQVGYSVQYEKNDYLLAQGRGMSPYISVVKSAITQLPSADERSELSVSGGYVQQNFRYKNHFFVTGAVRLDGSSVFGKDQRNQVYAKASGSYVVSSTDYWSKLNVDNWWDLLKFRMAYGQSGNLTGIGAFAGSNTYTSNAFVGKLAMNSKGVLVDENIKPERQDEIEFGMDLAFLNNRIGLQANYYYKKVKDLLFSRVIAPTYGYTSYLGNVGNLENKGFEIVLNVTPVRKSDITWDITAIFNRNRNVVTHLGQPRFAPSTNSGAPVSIIEGQPIGVFYGTFFARDNGQLFKNAAGILQFERGTQTTLTSYETRRENGAPTGDLLRKVIGDPNPDWTGTLVNEVSYKKFALRVQLDAVQGVDVWNADWRTRQGVGGGLVAQDEQMGKLPRGYVAGAYDVNEWRIDDGSFVKLREVAITYRFGKIKGLSDLAVSLSGRNLISFDNYKGYDPEVNAGGQSTILRGIDFGAVPIPRTFSLGIQAKF
ncbi:SusC/RagA family TonB-linked outer membrane protein [Pseudobacter ginsenosidimutans]|uniref:TonB-linked SusC/RagA family outer membrane protein n=1 Tax=Pseudobacter ginsenosidimutans TaxID=661488 RepID=A0A4Q7MB67_9BACT|nr:SusC/RagA family TonB-linked outer membrane protein [Pseudobacter ginsenosidimutans]RZS63962.1 TonB-linked SusC/RagA family outer membrane protein [Pseudobacter ginsenosidimutans]